MKFQPRQVRRFQEGGEMAPEAGYQEAPADLGQAQGLDPIVILALMSALAILNQDCQMAMQVCQAFLQIVQQMQGGGGQEVPESEPVYAKHGAKLIRRIKRAI